MTNRDAVTGIVLAGGRASRLGGAKLELRIAGRPLLDLAIEAVAAVAGRIVVAGPRPAVSVAQSVGLTFVEDRATFPGPLVALAGALEVAAGERAIVVAGDMPFLRPEVLKLLLAAVETDPSTPAAFLASPDGGKRQVLPIALRVDVARTAARAAVGAGDRSLMRLLDRLGGAEIPAADWLPLDPEARTLVDIDDPADLERWGAKGLQELP
jgi:molybdenum cofactor guanylyltransferase